jgi:ATP-dependent DNA helicase RecG
MLLRSIAAPLTAIRGIDSGVIPKLTRLGIRNIADLLCHYPREWQICTEVTVVAHDWIGSDRQRFNRPALKVYVEGENGKAALPCFNRPWLAKHLVVGGQFRLWGRFSYNNKYRENQYGKFEFEPIQTATDLNLIRSFYPLTAELTNEKLRCFIRCALEKYAAALEDEIPAEITERDKLLPKAAAIRAIHFPASEAELELAKKTLIYEELFYLEMMVGRRAFERRMFANNNPIPHSPMRQSRTPTPHSPLQQRLLERLSFSLTPGQERAIAEINVDMAHNGRYSMARLLQGDVGSGKTLVSFLAALRAVDDAATPQCGIAAAPAKGQTALMAPTELLARQHAENAARLLEPLGLRIAFLTGNIKAAGRKDLLNHLAAGEIDIVVGTHALFSKDVTYKNLRLVVIDEQHRFGVTQRSLIMSKGSNPHLLMMSATPIPRTLALTVFGDMDVSVIPDLPPGRKPIKTHLACESSERRVYDFVRNKLEAGFQAYFVYPLIENGDESNLKDAVSMAKRLEKEVFPRFTVALIHSKLEEEEKRRTMERFRRSEINLLAATSVVEVGVDVPNASCMVVEHAERFGLSALHQLRGRVGRGKDQAYCFLVYSDELTEDGKARLKVMLENADGFIIAEEDLKLRGPGQIAGTEQSGYLNLGIANPIRDVETLAKARADAFRILENDPGLVLDGHRGIARVLEESAPRGGIFGEVAL